MTAVGMHPDIDKTPVPTTGLRQKLVFDGTYNPAITQLLVDARNLGCDIIAGTEMFITQAAEQFRLWTGKQPDQQLLAESLK